VRETIKSKMTSLKSAIAFIGMSKIIEKPELESKNQKNGNQETRDSVLVPVPCFWYPVITELLEQRYLLYIYIIFLYILNY
jgi:hypothetical protein